MDKKHLLIIGEEKELVKSIGTDVSDHFHISSAIDSTRAMNMINKKKFDVVVVDGVTGTLDGIAVCTKINKHISTPFVPLVLLAQHGAIADIETAMRCGITSYIVGPYSAQVLADKVKDIIERKLSNN